MNAKSPESRRNQRAKRNPLSLEFRNSRRGGRRGDLTSASIYAFIREISNGSQIVIVAQLFPPFETLVAKLSPTACARATQIAINYCCELSCGNVLRRRYASPTTQRTPSGVSDANVIEMKETGRKKNRKIEEMRASAEALRVARESSTREQ